MILTPNYRVWQDNWFCIG